MDDRKHMKRAFAEQMRVVYALIMREMLTRFGHTKIGYVWALIEPMMHVAMFAAIKHALGAAPAEGTTIVTFLISGIIPFFLFRDCLNKIISAIAANKGLMVFHVIKQFDVYIARGILEIFTYLFAFTLAFTVIHVYVEPIIIGSLFYAIMWFLSFAALGIGLGFVFSPLCVMFPIIKTLLTLSIRVTYFTSGVIFVLDSRIPEEYQEIMAYNPISNMLEKLRSHLFFHYNPNEIFLDASYVFLFIAIAWFVGFILTKRYMRWIMER